MQVERISVVTPQVTQDIKTKINVGGHQVVIAVAQSLMTETQANKALSESEDMKGFYEAVALKYNTPEKLDELREMDQLSKDLLSRIVNIAVAILFSNQDTSELLGDTAKFLGLMGAVTSPTDLRNYLMVQSLVPAKTLAASLRETYTDEVIAEVVALPQT